MIRIALICCLWASAVAADVEAALSQHILPGYARLAERTQALAAASDVTCNANALHAPYDAARDAWVQIAHIQFGPLEAQGGALAFDFWPDPRGTVPKTLNRLLLDQSLDLADPAAFAEVSVAAQGFSALEWMLFTPQPHHEDACALIRAVAVSLADKSAELQTDWTGFAAQMQQAGAGQSGLFRSQADVQRALYTALTTGLEFLHDQRLGRPLGTFDRPRPRRAEAHRSGRSLRHVKLSLHALGALAAHLAPADHPRLHAAFASAQTRAAQLDDPALQGVADPIERVRIEALQQDVRRIQIAVQDEIGHPLGLRAGFNALDGD